jgi:SAM-dependent methyltransferase
MEDLNSFWNERFAAAEYIYGLLPNAFLKACLEQMTPGKLLLPGEGEGRNAVYAAKMGWSVFAFDSSEKAKQKAINLAKQNYVNINYEVLLFDEIEYPRDHFDAIAISYVHLPKAQRTKYHKKLLAFLKPGGALILEGFSKNQLNYSSGGPRELNMLYSVDELKSDFSEMKIQMIKKELVLLNEGPLHQGEASVIRLIATK